MGLARYYTSLFVRKHFSGSAFRRLDRFRRRMKTRLQQRAKARAIARFGRFDASQLHKELSALGIRKGGVLLVQSAFGRLYNFDGTAEEVIDVLEDLVGPEGTLMMPAHSLWPRQGPCVYDVRKCPTQAGILCELWRRRPGVRRSLHPTSSACAKGPLAETLLGDHHKDMRSCGPRSPYAKLADHDGQILGLGVPPGCTTFVHVIEDIDPDRYPKRTREETPVEYLVADEEGRQFSVPTLPRNPKVSATMKLSRVARHLSERAHRALSIHGVPVLFCRAALLLEELRLLANRGVTLYA